jgi:hypothetical protein
MPRRTRPAVLSLALTAGLSTGCKKLENAPAALDRLFPWFFKAIDEGTDEQLAEGFRNLHKAGDVKNLDDTVDGLISDLSKEDLAVVGLEGKNPSKAPGVYMLNPFQCGLGQLEKVLAHKNQDNLYPDAYDRYDRSYTSDRDAYFDRDEELLTWTVDYTATILSATYDSDLRGALRYVPELDDEATPFGPMLIARTYIPRPARFESNNKSLDQDYQIEMFYRHKGRIVHAYGLWREADFGSGINSESEIAQKSLLNELAKWDEETEANCAAGRP